MTDAPLSGRRATIDRQTLETRFTGEIDLDGRGLARIETGVGFLDHMLTHIARHGMIDVTLKGDGDIHVDAHHTVEDSAIVLGGAVRQALGDKAGITRYGHCLMPMDETLVAAAIDLSDRPMLTWAVPFTSDRLGTMETELVREWFQGFAQSCRATVHVRLMTGDNNHHIAEACFKGFARALRMAVEPDPRNAGTVPSTKGTLGTGA